MSSHFTHHILSTSETDDFSSFFSRIEPIEVDPCGMVFKGRPLVWSMSGVVGIGG